MLEEEFAWGRPDAGQLLDPRVELITDEYGNLYAERYDVVDEEERFAWGGPAGNPPLTEWEGPYAPEFYGEPALPFDPDEPATAQPEPADPKDWPAPDNWEDPDADADGSWFDDLEKFAPWVAPPGPGLLFKPAWELGGEEDIPWVPDILEDPLEEGRSKLEEGAEAAGEIGGMALDMAPLVIMMVVMGLLTQVTE